MAKRKTIESDYSLTLIHINNKLEDEHSLLIVRKRGHSLACTLSFEDNLKKEIINTAKALDLNEFLFIIANKNGQGGKEVNVNTLEKSLPNNFRISNIKFN